MDFKKILPHLIALAALIAVAAVFFAPNAFSGKALPQGDNDKARGMQTEIRNYIEKEGKAPLWTNSAFGGMPAYQIYAPIHGNLTTPVYRSLLLWTDTSTAIWVQVLLAMFCMYLLLNALRVDWRIGIFGALSFGITTYNMDLLEAGHTTKLIALALAPGILAGVVLAFNRKLLLGGALAALFMAIQVYANHVQITYYTLLICGFYFLAKLVDSIRQKNYIDWVKALVVSGIAFILGFASNTSRLWPTWEYSQETIRGKSDLAQKKSKGSGLDKDYLFGWSYGIDESLTLLVPHFAGGGAGESYKGTKLVGAVAPQAREQVKGLFYTGEQPFVGTAIYFGAIVFFLFVLGAFLVPGGPKYWLVAGAMFMVSLAWGKHFFLNYLLYDYLPMFNKFRAVSMALGPAQLCVAALAALGLQKICDSDIPAGRKKRALGWAAGTTGGLCLLAFLMGSTSGQYDNALEQNPDLLALLKEDRADMLRSDVLRSVFIVAIAAGLVWLLIQNRIKAATAVVVLTLVSLADNWMVCTRTLTSQSYQNKRTALAAPPEEVYDRQIKQDPDPHYRVLDLARGGITGNAVTSYFHKSLSGYHAAKLQRYQEVVDTFLTADLNRNLHIVGMFNGKYIISQQGDVIPNPQACGHAWFVRHVTVVPTPDEELQALRHLRPRDTAVVQQAFAEALKGLRFVPDSAAQIRLTSYHPEKMHYEYSAATEQLAVFPEIYYPPSKGWKCYLNGKAAPDFIKADYLLRAMRLPAGQNMQLEMRFEPQSYHQGEFIARIASGITLLLVAAGLVLWYRKHPVEDPNRLPQAPDAGMPSPASAKSDASAKTKRRKK
ncbi:MAG: hypothetical protein IPM81_15550 [Saprospirales bacterium]|nr:hypothetical protein [Saprospirales bacterium]